MKTGKSDSMCGAFSGRSRFYGSLGGKSADGEERLSCLPNSLPGGESRKTDKNDGKKTEKNGESPGRMEDKVKSGGKLSTKRSSGH